MQFLIGIFSVIAGLGVTALAIILKWPKKPPPTPQAPDEPR